MNPVVRPLPHLDLPAAYVRLWPGAETTQGSEARLGLDLDAVAAPFEGVVRVGELPLLAVMPVAGRASVVDAAIRLARLVLERADPGVRALVYPGRLRRGPSEVEPVRDIFAEDLDKQRPPLPAEGGDPHSRLVVTGYAAARVQGRLSFRRAGTFDPPSGRRVPLSVPAGDAERPDPTHDPEILGKRVHVARPELEAELEDILSAPVFQVAGPLGVGKSHLLWHRLKGEIDAADWLVAGPDRLAAPPLAETLGERFGVTVTGDEDPFELASRLVRSAPPESRLVLDVTAASWDDRELVDALVENAADGAARWTLIQREPTPGWDELPTLAVPPFGEEEMAELVEKLCASLELPEPMQERYVAAAAGHPLALGQSLLRLLHRGLLRQVYGSYFYAGGREAELEVSEQLVSEVEAEVRRLGDPLPLRLLATVDGPIASHHLQQACDRFGIELENDWHEPLRAAGLLDWVGGSADRLAFLCPAYGVALRQTAPGDAGRTLRHALGGVFADEEAGWRAYRLLAGTPEALPSLLDASRDGSVAEEPSSGVATREELFNALWEEHREHRERGGDEVTELEILWNLLPLAHRLGTLGRLRGELERAVELALREGHGEGRGSTRHVALAALLAELDQEQGRYREAEEALRDALTASQGLDETRRASLFVRLGTLLAREERFGEARAVFGELLKLATSAGSKSLEATCRYHLGHLALMERRLDEAKKEHEAAAELRREAGREKAWASSLVALGQVALAQGDAHSALRRFESALEHLAAVGAESWEHAGALVGRARALERLGELGPAVRSLRQALEAQRSSDSAGEAVARLTLGAIFLQQGKVEEAEIEARKAHFQASLLSDASLLGDAERLLGRCAERRAEPDEAFAHFYEALDLHGRHDDEALAEDRGALLELSLRHEDADGVFLHSAELRTLLDELRSPRQGEVLNFRLYRGLSWLRERDISVPDPVIYLRAAYQELMRKTGFLPPERRHVFLYQVRDHQDLLEAAAEHDLSLPVFTV